jgi:hypothetical protein
MNHFVGGIAFPYLEKPGFFLLISVEEDKTNQDTPWKFQIIDEGSDHNLPSLFKRCLAKSSGEHPPQWYGNAMNKSIMDLVYRSVPHLDKMSFSPAPYIDDTDCTVMYLHIIKEMNQQNKVFWFGDNSQLPRELRGYDKTNVKPIHETPPIAALAYASAVLYLWLQKEGEGRKRKSDAERIVDQVEMAVEGRDEEFPYGMDEDSDI